ncbi:MAG TPA: 50S ribosomal protein L6 [Chloroflexota bacterium]|jgi:large subunit ribosomal protein L6|nr:50S ribosomal protein L6 [Chloroflexota bacterium]
MSRIGRMPIPLPANVQVEISPERVRVKGPKGELERPLPAGISVVREDGVLRVQRASDAPQHKALHGLMRTLIANMVTGVTAGFEKRLEIQGTGYRAQQLQNAVVIQVGYSHPIEFEPPPGIQLSVEPGNRIVVSGADKELVGEIAARIRRLRPPEPYKGKGIRYLGENVRRKAGKAAGKKR